LDPQEYEIMFRVEQQHWWYLGMQSITRSILNRWYAPGAGLSILDAGCGTGSAMTTYLAEYGTVTGLEVSELALGFCRSRKAQRLVCASVTQLPFSSKRFELVTSFDVLYEQGVPDDASALDEFSRVLVRGGRVVLRLPAYDWLRGQHDKGIHTARRYTAGQVAALLRKTGFQVEHTSYANTLLFPVALVKRTAEHIWPPHLEQSDLALNAGPFNRLLQDILSLEAPIVSHAGLPYGLSVIAVGLKN
jgi:ubiquinone/menaquinone biosynthesis C-methylase UbiE